MEVQEIIKNVLNSDTLGICIKSIDGQVGFQNSMCLKACGQRMGMVCEDGCMRLRQIEKCDKSETGTQMFRGKKVGEFICDVVIINDGKQLITLLVDLAEKIQTDCGHFARYNLSPREQEVIKHVIAGDTNAMIASKLFISKATLKTHLNNIYRKIPEHVITIWRSPRTTQEH